MATLLDAIRQNSQTLANQPVPDTNETSKAAGLLAAKTGKNVGGGGEYALSNLGEQQQNAQTQQALQNQVAPAAATQQAGLEQQQASQQQQFGEQQQQTAQQRQFNTLQTQLQTTSMLNDMERQKGAIDMAANRAQVDQVATNLRLQNQKYINDLTLEGNKNRLDNQLNFQTELAKSIFGNKTDLIQKQLGDKSILDANKRDFSKAMANLDINASYDIMNREIAGSQQRAVYGAAGSLVTAGIGAAAGMGGSKSAPSLDVSEEPEATGDIGVGNVGSMA